MRGVWFATAALGGLVVAGLGVAGLAVAGSGVAEAKPPANPAHEHLLSLAPQDRAAWLARAVGEWCIGTDPFLMGVAQTGAAAGNAYWSFNCIGYGSYVTQLQSVGGGVTIDCATFKQNGGGKECFKKF